MLFLRLDFTMPCTPCVRVQLFTVHMRQSEPCHAAPRHASVEWKLTTCNCANLARSSVMLVTFVREKSSSCKCANLARSSVLPATFVPQNSNTFKFWNCEMFDKPPLRSDVPSTSSSLKLKPCASSSSGTDNFVKEMSTVSMSSLLQNVRNVARNVSERPAADALSTVVD